MCGRDDDPSQIDLGLEGYQQGYDAGKRAATVTDGDFTLEFDANGQQIITPMVTPLEPPHVTALRQALKDALREKAQLEAENRELKRMISETA